MQQASTKCTNLHIYKAIFGKFHKSHLLLCTAHLSLHLKSHHKLTPPVPLGKRNNKKQWCWKIALQPCLQVSSPCSFLTNLLIPWGIKTLFLTWVLSSFKNFSHGLAGKGAYSHGDQWCWGATWLGKKEAPSMRGRLTLRMCHCTGEPCCSHPHSHKYSQKN